MKGGEISANKSKKTKPDKASFQELFIAIWKIKSQLENVSVRDENRKPCPVMHLLALTEGYIPQANDRISSDSSGGNSLKRWRADELLHDRLSWEAIGIAKGKLPSTMIVDQQGNERYPFMTMNGIIIDDQSPEFRNRTKQITTFATSAMLPALAEIESVYNDHIEEEVRAFRNKGPFAILDKIQAIQIRLQNLLFSNMSIIDADIKSSCSIVVRNHQEALSMKEKLELSIAMLELADNKISKTHDHDTANRIIDAYRSGLRTAVFQNIAEKNELAAVLQTYKASRDQGNTLDLEILLGEIVGVFGHTEEEAEPTLQAAMLASTTKVDYQEQRVPSSAGGASRPSQPYKRRYEEDKTISAQDGNVLEKILKSLFDLKSEVGFIKKHIVPEQPRQTETQAPKKFVNKGAESNKRTVNFAGVARESTTFRPKSLVDRPLTTIDDNSEESAFMAMTDVQQPRAKNNFRIMTAQNNRNVLGDYCVRSPAQESHGAGYDLPTINSESIRIPETIQKMYSPQSSAPIDQLSTHLRTQVAETIMLNLMSEQQDMEVVSDDNSRIPTPSDIYEPAIPYHFPHVQDQQSPPPKAVCIATPSMYSPSAPQVELIDTDREIEIAGHDEVKRPILFTETSVAGMRSQKSGPITRSSSRIRNLVIPESATLSDSEDDNSVDSGQVRLVPYGASKSPAASISFPSPALPHLDTQVLPKLGNKANRTTGMPAYDHKDIYDDVPPLEHSSSDEGDM
jgi:hypothetical protein